MTPETPKSTERASYTPLFVTVGILGVAAWIGCMAADLSYASAVGYTVGVIIAITMLFAAFRLFTIGNTLVEIREILSKEHTEEKSNFTDA